MLMTEKTRKVEVLVGSRWELLENIGRLEPGDVIRMYESDGTPIILTQEDGSFRLMQVKSHPHFNVTGIAAIRTTPIKSSEGNKS